MHPQIESQLGVDEVTMAAKIWSRSFWLKSRRAFTCLAVFGILVYARQWVVVRVDGIQGSREMIKVIQGHTTRSQYPRGQILLDQMLTGHWVPRKYTVQEMGELEAFNKRVWTFYKIPHTLQREDKKCGNVSFPGLAWFRGLCDPKGATPCCMNNSCVNRSVQECQCPDCYDVRPQIYAEFATWLPDDTTVKLTKFTTEKDACRVLQNKTVYFIGDSFMRQLYTSVLAMLRDAKPRHVIRDNVPLANVTNCDKYYRFVADCRNYLIWSTKECNGTTNLSMKSIYKAQNSDGPLKSIRELNGTVNSWLVVGLGAHDYYNITAVRQHMIDPLLNILKNSTWPKLIWMASHSPGLLKTGTEKRQQSQALLDYNDQLTAILNARGIPILKFFDFTKGVFSFDGAHYGSIFAINFLTSALEPVFLKSSTYIYFR
ncbi:unnamed protein product [Lymnaea stagnalis]|uniref:Uncharacterized protein n=1 Tax=Lymnaea stagnalis TaxID=6523 RepID=A0AAV2HHE1_LYMST